MSVGQAEHGTATLSVTVQRIAVAALAILAIWALSHVVLLVFFSVLLALMLRGAADWLAGRLRMPAGLMLWLVGVLAFLALAGLIYWIGPRLVAQGNDLVSTLREQSATLSRHFDQSQIGKHVSDQLSSIGQYVFGTATTALGMGLNTALDIVVITLTTLYLAAQPSLYVRGLVHLVPPDRRRRTLDVLHDIARVLRLWVLGQLIDMVTVGAMSAVGLALLGVPAPFALAVLAGLLTFIPYLGAIAAGVPAVLVALSVSWQTALWTLAIYTACHMVEGYVVAPLVQRRLIDLPPALTIVTMTVTGALFGPLGVVLGTPLAATGLVLVRELYVKDTLQDFAAPPASAPLTWRRRIMAPDSGRSLWQ